MCERQVRLFKWGYMICGSGRRPDGGIDYMDAGWVGLRPLAGCLGLTVVFLVEYRTTGGVWFIFFKSFLLASTKFSFWRGDWALRYNSVGFGHFAIVS